MKIEYDREADALYIQFQPGNAKETVKIRDGIVVDIAKDGKIYGIEILDVSRRIPPSQIERIDSNLPIGHSA